MTTPSDAHSGYTFGYSKATISSHASRTIHTEAAFVLPHLKPHHRILDIGCGPGTITIGFASLVDPAQGGGVTGVDIGDRVLTEARALAEASNLSSAVTFQQGNVLQTLPFADNTFDVVFTSHTLSHLAPQPSAPVAALKEMRRVLKPGGVLAARDASTIDVYPFREEIKRCLYDRMFRVVGTGAPCGARMPEFLRAAGWEVDDPDKVRVGGGSTVITGRERVGKLAASLVGRLAEGDPFREGWLKAGITEEECDETRALVERWSQTQDAWYGSLQSEVLAWK